MPLSPTEPAEGWKVLFDGRTLSGWRGYRSSSTPDNWKVVDGTLFRAAGGGDIMSVDEFGNFELRLEWRISRNGNSGIMFRVTTDGDEPWWSGPEMQVLDNEGHPDGRDPLTSAGSNYALHAPVRDVTRPVGEWNAVRIVANGAHVEYWLNDVKIVEYELWSRDWEARVRATKFAQLPQYGRAPRGHIVLQDHGDAVWYRNIRVKPL
jgi:Domain of Unknown Function (DUF1080)